ncbi:MAG: CBS domain-containing protein [Anaerolineales bacterium]|jgi:CBS domain-containing protein|uniref:CBS domain-containing protein n=1 Tax=Candidatus Villigracilis affinis TaxID=3140682 RepID=UPI001D2E80D8|nr:CBS domain-containing protein [Anaerolineales bacterium]MBK9602438.1 CBS domain-containing protein [Anaerolineales bacterium]MBL0347495.1 CBS domain-containing protein [Anaerolineales bacterium]
MPHLVRDWMSSPVVVVDPDSSVSYAMTLMRRRNIHSVVVDISEKNPSYGIVTTTDIRDKIVAVNRNPAEITVREIMSGPIITGRAEWTLMECSQLMQKHKFHHLPIADEHGSLIGLISATDIFMSVEEQGWEEEKKD